MRTSNAAAAVVITLGLSACSSGPESDAASDDVVAVEYARGGTAETEEYANDPDAAYEPLVVGLDTEHDFGDGFTIRIDGLERLERFLASRTGVDATLSVLAPLRTALAAIAPAGSDQERR